MAVRVDVLGSGSKGNSTFVQGGRTRILLDAGFSAAELQRRLARVGVSPSELDAVVLTHEHCDHVRGAAVFARRHGLPVACQEDTLERAGLAGAALPEWVPLRPGRPLSLGDLLLEPFAVPHDAAATVGVRVRAEGLAVGCCTDLGHVTPLVRERLRGCHVLVVESNHDLDMLRDGPYPWPLKQRVGGRHGHLSNDAAGELLADVVDGEATVVALAHLSEVNNDPHLALATARRTLERGGHDAVHVVALAQDRVARLVPG